MALKIIYLNVEVDKHKDKVKALIEREDPDALCLLEVYEEDLSFIAGNIYKHLIFTPNSKENIRGAKYKVARLSGATILSRLPIGESKVFYAGDYSIDNVPTEGLGTHSPIMLRGKIEKDGQIYQIAATHFTWTPDGSVSQEQISHLVQMLQTIKGEEIAWGGDFNTPRGSELYQQLVSVYKDNIPAAVDTTIDPRLHRANLRKRASSNLWLTISGLHLSIGSRRSE